MLDSMEADVDEAQNQVDVLTRKTKELIKKSGYIYYYFHSLSFFHNNNKYLLFFLEVQNILL